MRLSIWAGALLFVVTAAPGGCGGSGGQCVASVGAATNGDTAEIGTVDADIGGSSSKLPVCPGGARCQCSDTSFAVSGTLDTGIALVVSLGGASTIAPGTFANDQGSNIALTEPTGNIYSNDPQASGTSGTVTLTSYSATGTATGTFSGTVVLSPVEPAGPPVTITNGTFTCECNK